MFPRKRFKRFQNVSQSSSRLKWSKYPEKLARKNSSTLLSFGYALFGTLISAFGEVSMKRLIMLAPMVREKFLISSLTAASHDPSISRVAVVVFETFLWSSSYVADEFRKSLRALSKASPNLVEK